MSAILLRGASVLLGEQLQFDPAPLDVLVKDGRITAIAPAGSLNADRIVDLQRHL
jgi:hypothetical protein